jgi:hypothetical protein
MKKTIELFEAKDGDQSYAIRLKDDPGKAWRFTRGYGADYQKVWTVELESSHVPEPDLIEWESVLERALEAWQMNDPFISNYEWPIAITD